MCAASTSSASPAVDELQASDGTAFVVGLNDETAEQSVANNSRRELHGAIALLLDHERRLGAFTNPSTEILASNQSEITLVLAH